MPSLMLILKKDFLKKPFFNLNCSLKPKLMHLKLPDMKKKLKKKLSKFKIWPPKLKLLEINSPELKTKENN